MSPFLVILAGLFRGPLPHGGVFRPSSSCFRGSGLLFPAWLSLGFLVLPGHRRASWTCLPCPFRSVCVDSVCWLCLEYCLDFVQIPSLLLACGLQFPFPSGNPSHTCSFSRACPRGHGGWEVSISCGNRRWCFRRVDKGWEKAGIPFTFCSPPLHEAY